MINRRMLVALTACLVLSASTAMAGGGGAKKDSTVKVVNNTGDVIYAFVDVTDAEIIAAGGAVDPIAALQALGGKEIAAGGSANFQVKAGPHFVRAVDISIPNFVGSPKSVTTTKGKTATVNIP